MALQLQADLASESMAVFHMIIKNDLPEIANVNAKFEKFTHTHNLPAVMRQKMSLAFDDLLNNVISYAFRDDEEHEIEIRGELTRNRLTVTISDDGVPFNPLGIQAPDTSLSLEDRKVGGMGIHLVRSMVDDISYRRGVNRNVLSLVMHVVRDDGVS